MIRLIVALVGLFVLWVLFFSNLTKNQKIIISSIAVILSVLGLWYESTSNKPRQGIVQIDQVTQCGIKVAHTYRSNYDIKFCIRNGSDNAYIKRISLDIYAQQCDESNQCQELQRVARDLKVDLKSDMQKEFTENLSFEKVNKDNKVSWAIEIKQIQAFNE